MLMLESEVSIQLSYAFQPIKARFTLFVVSIFQFCRSAMQTFNIQTKQFSLWHLGKHYFMQITRGNAFIGKVWHTLLRFF